jgi:hypothetical protein
MAHCTKYTPRPYLPPKDATPRTRYVTARLLLEGWLFVMERRNGQWNAAVLKPCPSGMHFHIEALFSAHHTAKIEAWVMSQYGPLPTTICC